MPAVQKSMSAYVVYHVNVDKEPKVTQMYGVTSIPRYMIVTPTGRVIKDGQDYKDESGFLLWLNSAKQ